MDLEFETPGRYAEHVIKIRKEEQEAKQRLEKKKEKEKEDGKRR